MQMMRVKLVGGLLADFFKRGKLAELVIDGEAVPGTHFAPLTIAARRAIVERCWRRVTVYELLRVCGSHATRLQSYARLQAVVQNDPHPMNNHRRATTRTFY